MTSEQILRKVIKKVAKNGYDVGLSGNGNVKVFNGKEIAEKILTPIEFIFSHDFAKAFWGEKYSNTYYELGIGYDWEYHLFQMVLEKDPIKYLERFINEIH